MHNTPTYPAACSATHAHTHTHTQTHAQTHTQHTCTCTLTQIHTNPHTLTQTPAHTHTHTYTCTHTHTATLHYIKCLFYIFFYRFLLPALPQHLWAELQTQKSSAIEKTSKRYPMLRTYTHNFDNKPELTAVCSDHRGREGSTVLACTYVRMSVHATVISCTVLRLRSAQHSMSHVICTCVCSCQPNCCRLLICTCVHPHSMLQYIHSHCS